ncbi:MAG: restriction endonuclease subunit S [Eubacterium sp.]|nr:restriction endonuclease subunit S [Eubacterium sp.]
MNNYQYTFYTDNLPYEKVGKNEPVCIADEVPFEIPESWEWVRLGSIGETNIGLTYKPSDKVDAKSGTAVLRSNNIQKGKMDYSDMVYVSCNVPERAMISKGDILICARNGSRALVGKSAIVDMDGMAFGAFMAKYTSLLSGMINPYILTFIESPVFRGQLDGVKTETINQITQEMIKEQLIPIPPLAEQIRINEKLEELMPYIEKYGVAYLEATKLNETFPDMLKKSILQEAVQGKLVPQDPADEPASVLLERIRAEKEQLIKDGKIKRDKHKSVIFRRDNSHYEKRGSEEVCIDEELPFEIPQNWEWCYLGDIAFVTKLAGFEYTKYIAPNLADTGIPLFKGKNVQNGKLVLNFEGYIPEHLSDELSRSQITKKCLLTPYVGTIGNIAIFDGSFKAHLGSNVGKIELINPIDCACVSEEYVLHYLRSPAGYQQLTKHKKATAQESISIDAIRNVIIPVPPINEQERIIYMLADLDKKVQAL